MIFRSTPEEFTQTWVFQSSEERGDLIMERARREDETRVLERIIARIKEGGIGRNAVAIRELEYQDLITVFPQFSTDIKAGYVLKPHVDIVDEDGAHSEELQKIQEAFNAPADFDVYHPRYIMLLSEATRGKRWYQKCSVEQRGAKALWITGEYLMPWDTVIRRGEPLILYKQIKKERSCDSIMVGGIQVLKGLSYS